MSRSAPSNAPVRGPAPPRSLFPPAPPSAAGAAEEGSGSGGEESLTHTSYSAEGDEPRVDDEEEEGNYREQIHDQHEEQEEDANAVHYSHPTLPPRASPAAHTRGPSLPRTPVAGPLLTPLPSSRRPDPARSHSHSTDESHESGLSTVPSTPSLDHSPSAHMPQPRRRLLDAGLAAMKKNLYPGLALQCVALIIILVYYGSSSAQAAFDQLAEFKADAGYLFSGVSTMIFGGLLPMLIINVKKEYERRKAAKAVLMATGLDISSAAPDARSSLGSEAGGLEQHHVTISGTDPLEPLQLEVLAAQKPAHTVPPASDGTVSTTGAVTLGATRGPSLRGELLFMAGFWFLKGMEVDAFYRLQAIMWGEDSKFVTILGKVLFDQFIYNPPWAAPSTLGPYYWKDSNFSFTRTWAYVTSRHFWCWVVPECLMSGWMVWIPACSMVYLMPAALQIPLFNVVLCFWSLVLMLITGK